MIVEFVSAGVLAVWGSVDDVALPWGLSSGASVNKKGFGTLAVDKDLPFKLDHLPDLPIYVLPGHFQTLLVDESCYQHLPFHVLWRT